MLQQRPSMNRSDGHPNLAAAFARVHLEIVRMAYEWDVFFSYKRDKESNDWHQRVMQKVAYWCSQELGRDAKFFFDTESIPIGKQWPATLKNGLLNSRCLLCVWSPMYFRSEWCVSEWLTFVQREALIGTPLIAPASYFDGSTFPERAKNTQCIDFSPFASTMPRFWDTECAVDFEPVLRKFAQALANLIKSAPDHDDFPIYEAKPVDVQLEGDITRIADL